MTVSVAIPATPSTRGDSPIHVLMTVDAEGGVWTYAVELVRATRSLGVRYTVGVLGRPPSRAARHELEQAGADVHTFSCRLEWMPSAEEDVDRSSAWLEDLAEQVMPDVVHVNGYSHAASRFCCPTLVVAHSCVCSWWRAVHGCAAPPEWDEYRQRVRRGLESAARVVAPTSAMLQALQAEHGAVPGAHIIRNGLDAIRMPERDKEPFVFAAGRLWDEAKNLRMLDAAASRVGWPIVVAGAATGPDGRECPPAAARWRGVMSRDETREVMIRASIYAWPARYEPFGLSVLEAAQAGCALILGDIPTLRELWNGAAEFIAADDINGLVAAIDSLADDPARCHTLGSHARTRAREYSAVACGHAYAQLYRELVDEEETGRRAKTAATYA
jgi:glycosyltransferase involved in cell wall biosynthesis